MAHYLVLTQLVSKSAASTKESAVPEDNATTAVEPAQAESASCEPPQDPPAAVPQGKAHAAFTLPFTTPSCLLYQTPFITAHQTCLKHGQGTVPSEVSWTDKKCSA